MFEVVVINNEEKEVVATANSQKQAIEYVNAIRTYNNNTNCYYRYAKK